MEEQKIDIQQAKKDVLIMSDRLASLYYFMIKSMLEELPEESVERIVRRAIDNYGQDCGNLAQEKVKAMDLPLILKNYALANDLPSIGWEKKRVETGDDNVKVTEVRYCPLAVKWKELDFEKWGRIYCYVDQAKYSGYNNALTCYHDKNVLDGDDFCVVRIVKDEQENGNG